MIRSVRVWTSGLVLMLVGVATAQSFAGTFQEPQTGMTITFSQAQPGALAGTLTGPNGQFPLQGQTNGQFAYGVVSSQQGPLGFQAQMSPDGAMLQIAFFQTGADGQVSPAGPTLTMRRADGAGMGGMSGGMSGGMGGQPGGMPGGVGGSMPGGMGGQPGGVPGGVGGQPGGMPGGMGGQPGGMPGGMGGQPGGMTGGMGGMTGMAALDWNGVFVGDNGSVTLAVQGSQGNYVGTLQFQGQQYQYQAHLDDATLHGSFGAGYEFWADRDGQTVYLYLGDTTYILQQRQ